jgi:hypothetical protein
VQMNQCYSLTPYLFISCGLVLPVLSWFSLLSFTVCRIPWRIFSSGDLVVIYCFSFCLLWKSFVAPSILNDNFTGYTILWLKLFSFSAQSTSVYAPLAFKISVQKSTVILMSLFLYVICFFSVTAFNILYSLWLLF